MPSRRHILAGLAATALTCGDSTVRPRDKTLLERIRGAAPAAIAYLENPETAAAVGVAALEGLADPNDEAIEALVAPALTTIEKAPPTGSTAALEAKVEADFAALLVLDVEGWTLSATEVGLAVIVASA